MTVAALGRCASVEPSRTAYDQPETRCRGDRVGGGKRDVASQPWLHRPQKTWSVRQNCCSAEAYRQVGPGPLENRAKPNWPAPSACQARLTAAMHCIIAAKSMRAGPAESCRSRCLQSTRCSHTPDLIKRRMCSVLGHSCAQDEFTLASIKQS